MPTDLGVVRCWEARGSGPDLPVLIVHGISASSIHFVRVMLGLKRSSRRVLAIDLPGHGASDTPAVLTPQALEDGTRQAMGQLLDERFVLFGNSLGGLAAIRTTLAYPDRVAGLVLCSPGGAPMDPQRLQAFLGNFRFAQREPAAAFVNKCLAYPVFYAPIAASVVIEDFDRIGGLLASISSDDLLGEDEVAALSCPILLQWGERDHLMPEDHRAWFRERLPAHTYESPPDFGHCPNLDRPGKLVRSVRGFVRTLES
ncbi:MAG: alpha/beta hydrolase [Proteobacteria bacterium]|nr:alpha/beta hydrolase [Pseudomonadota bacterium]